MPAREAIDAHGEELDVVPVANGAGVHGPHGEPRDLVAEGRQTAGADLVERALRNHEAALPVLTAVEHDEDAPGLDAAERLRRGVAGHLRQPEPEDVHRRAERLDAKAGCRAHRGVAAVGADDEIGANLQRTVGRRRPHADDSPIGFQEADDARAHAQREARIAPRVAGEEVEEVPLRHEGDEGTAHGQVAEVGDGDPLAADDPGQLADLRVRQRQERLEQAELVHDLERGGMDRIAAEVAQEVGVLLEHDDLHARPRQQQAEHHPGRPAARDAAARRERRHAARRRPARASSSSVRRRALRTAAARPSLLK